jgi:hypothetical protein
MLNQIVLVHIFLIWNAICSADPMLFNGPRSQRPLKSMFDISDMFQSIPSFDYSLNRSYYHVVDDHDGLYLRYNVTLQEGIYNLDLNTDIIHVECNNETFSQSIQIHSSKPSDLFRDLSGFHFIIGDMSWGCQSGMYNDSRPEPIYRRIEHILLENNTVFVLSHPISFTHLFVSTDIYFHVKPGYHQRRLSTDYTLSDSWVYLYNYDVDTDQAINRKIEIENSFSSAFCEECYFYFDVGFIFELNVETGTYGWPYVNGLTLEFYGESKLSAYIRIVNPQQGTSEPYTLLPRTDLVPLTIPVLFVPLILYPSFELFAQVDIVESTMDVSLLTGFTASASVSAGIQIPVGTSTMNIISDNDWNFDGTPLSLGFAEKTGKLNPRLYLIPRLYLSPYGLAKFYVDLKPYVGVELWPSNGIAPSNPVPISDSFYNSASVPSQPNPPTFVVVSKAGLQVLLNPPSSSLPITGYRLRYICSNCYDYYFTDYLYPGTIGFFQKSSVFTSCPSTTPNWDQSVTVNAIDESGNSVTTIGNIITCADICNSRDTCVMFSYRASDTWCFLYATTSLSFSSSNTCENWVKSSTGTSSSSKYFALRNGDILSYEAEGEEATTSTVDLYLGSSFIFSPYEYSVSVSALNAKGYSTWSEPLAISISISSCTTTISYDNFFATIYCSTNLPNGEQVMLSFYEDDNTFDDLIASVAAYVSNGAISYQLSIYNYYTAVYYEEGSNNQHIYSQVSYGDQNPWVYTAEVEYSPVSQISLSSSTSGSQKNVRFNFYASYLQVPKFEIWYYSTYYSFSMQLWKIVSTADICDQSWYCTLDSGYFEFYSIYLYAYDTTDTDVLLTSQYFSSLSSAASSSSSMLALSKRREGDEHKGFESVLKADLVSFQKNFSFLSGNEEVLEKQNSVMTRRSLSETCAPSDNGLNYVLYTGLDIVAGMEEVSIPVLGLVLFEAMQLPQMAVIEPIYLDAYTFGTGCLVFPEMEPQLLLLSPKFGDHWGVGSSHHTIQWDFWSVDEDDQVSITFYQHSTGEFVTSTTASAKDVISYHFSSSYFEENTDYDCIVELLLDSSVQSSATFTIVPLSQDLSASDSVSFEDSEYDDTVVSFSGYILETAAFAVRLGEETKCQAKYSSFPLNVLCKLQLIFEVSSTEIYSIELSVGASFDDLESLTNEGLTISYGLLLPEFSFPAGSTTSYFLEQLGDTKLSSSSNFPGSDNMDMLKFSIPDGDSLCLSRLLELIDESFSDLTEGAKTVSEAIAMLGVDACISPDVVSSDLENGGIQFSLLASAKAFDDADVDWTSFFDSIENSWFQKFLLLSGSASETMADEIFNEILNVIGITEPLACSFDVGSKVLSLFNNGGNARQLSSTPAFVAESGVFQLGSYATGTSIIDTMSPTASPTTSPTASPTTSPSASQSTMSPTASPTTSPSASQSTMSPTASPTTSPESEFPTFTPTETTVVSTIVSFGADVTLAGISSEDFDEAAQKAFQQVTADALTGDVSPQSILITSHVSSSGISKRLLRSLSSSLLVSFTVENVMETTDFNDPMVMGSTYQQDIEDAFADPATAIEWAVTSESLGSSTISSSTIVTFSAPTYTTPISVVVVTTPEPTNAPSLKPEAAPRGSNGDTKASDDAMIYGIIGAVVAVVLLVIGATAYHILSTRRQKAAVEEPAVSLQNAKAVVIENPLSGFEMRSSTSAGSDAKT